MRIAAARDSVSSLPGAGAIKPMPEAEIAKAVRLLDLMFEFFAYHGCWQNGGHCLVGALLHLSRKRSGGLNRLEPLALGATFLLRRGTEGSNPSPYSGESTNHRFLSQPGRRTSP